VIKKETCRSCGKELKMSTRSMEVLKGSTPSIYQNDKDWPKLFGQKVLKVTKRSQVYHGDEQHREKHELAVCWLGDYEGYGSSPDRIAPLFCTLRCSLSFAEKAYRAGWRMSKIGLF